MRKLILVNIILASLWGLSFLLAKINFPYFLFIFGLLFFFLPGLNLTLMLEQWAGLRQGLAKIIIWSFLASLTLTPTVIYAISLWKNCLGVEGKTIVIFLVWWLITLLLLIISFLIKRNKLTELVWPDFKKQKIFWWALLIWLIVLAGNFLLYRYIPEADGYTYIGRINAVMQNHFFSLDQGRTLFYVFSWTWLFLSKIPLYWLFKIVLPLLSSIIILVLYQYSSRISQNKLVVLMGALGLVSFPVIVMEILISRPQSIFLLALPLVLFLLSDILKSKNPKNLAWLFYVLIIVFFSLFIHQFFIFLLLISLVAFVISHWSKIKKYPWISLFIFGFIIFSFYPWLRDFSILDQFIKLGQPFWRALTHPKIDLWFINNYVNVDGSQMGWPGISQLYYYGYNLGLTLPVLIILALVRKIKINFQFKENWLYLFSFLIFFSIAEIFPRIGLAFLPDRAWLFAAVSLLFFLPYLFQAMADNLKPKITFYICIGLLLISVGLGFSITYAKKGWTTPNEYDASQFIKNNLPQNAAIISQGANGPLISYFANRVFAKPTVDFFNNSWDGSELTFMINLPDYISRKSAYLKQENNLEQVIEQKGEALSATTDPAKSVVLIADLVNATKKLQPVKQRLYYVKQQNLDQIRPIYILYSKDKFTGLYGQRAWWKEMNFYQADLEKFDQYSEYFTKIYNQNGVQIWQVKLP